MNLRYFLLLSLLFSSLFGASVRAQDEESTPILRFGVLPVLNTLPLYVAEAAGYFEEAGVAVQIGRFRSAAKLRSAVRQGEMDGFQADLVSALKLHESGQGLQVVRHVGIADILFFALVTWPWSGIATVDNLEGARIGISHNTVVQYVADSMLAFAGVSTDEVEYVEAADQMSRLLQLAQGVYDAAVLPQPYLKWALDFGSRVLIDDTALDYVPEAVSFRAEVLEHNGEAVRAFLQAYERGVVTLNAMSGDPEAFREFRSDPEVYPNFWPPVELFFHLAVSVPNFSTAGVPSEADFASVKDWALVAGLLEQELAYESMVADQFLPEAGDDDSVGENGDG